MLDVEIRYWPKAKPIPKGWKYHDGLEGTHHGVYSCLIVRDVKNGGR
ncbi:unnamed protein product [marine sediment metagenome]|uniref:Uncharacterized protein n=1 Tax=marine sediment metagenome TaxID=412755 RepID=X0S667_9ZZZZ